MKKSLKTILLYVVAIATFISVGASISYFTKQSASAEKIVKLDTEEEQVNKAQLTRVTNATILSNIMESVYALQRSDVEVDQEVLDTYAYYLLDYARSNVRYVGLSENGIRLPAESLRALLEVYKKHNLDAPYEVKSDSEINVLRTVKEPENKDELVSEVKKEVLKQNQESSGKLKANIDVDVVKEKGGVTSHE